MSKHSQNKNFSSLYEVIALLNNPDDVERFMLDLCTPKELRDFSERWQIARLLSERALSYREISKDTGASTTTVARVARFLNQENNHGYKIALERISKK